MPNKNAQISSHRRAQGLRMRTQNAQFRKMTFCDESESQNGSYTSQGSYLLSWTWLLVLWRHENVLSKPDAERHIFKSERGSLWFWCLFDSLGLLLLSFVLLITFTFVDSGCQSCSILGGALWKALGRDLLGLNLVRNQSAQIEFHKLLSFLVLTCARVHFTMN